MADAWHADEHAHSAIEHSYVVYFFFVGLFKQIHAWLAHRNNMHWYIIYVKAVMRQYLNVTSRHSNSTKVRSRTTVSCSSCQSAHDELGRKRDLGSLAIQNDRWSWFTSFTGHGFVPSLVRVFAILESSVFPDVRFTLHSLHFSFRSSGHRINDVRFILQSSQSSIR